MFIQAGDEILRQEEVFTQTQVALVGRHHCFATKVVLAGPQQVTVGQAATFTAQYYDWQDSPLPGENRSMRVHAGENVITLQPENGQAEFDLQVDYVPEGGKLVIEAAGEGFGCNAGVLEVAVVEEAGA